LPPLFEESSHSKDTWIVTAPRESGSWPMVKPSLCHHLPSISLVPRRNRRPTPPRPRAQECWGLPTGQRWGWAQRTMQRGAHGEASALQTYLEAALQILPHDAGFHADKHVVGINPLDAVHLNQAISVKTRAESAEPAPKQGRKGMRRGEKAAAAGQLGRALSGMPGRLEPVWPVRSSRASSATLALWPRRAPSCVLSSGQLHPPGWRAS